MVKENSNAYKFFRRVSYLVNASGFWLYHQGADAPSEKEFEGILWMDHKKKCRHIERLKGFKDLELAPPSHSPKKFSEDP